MLTSGVQIRNGGVVSGGFTQSAFVEALNTTGRMTSARILNNNSVVFNDTNINSINLYWEAGPFKSVMRVAEVELNGIYSITDVRYTDLQLGVSADVGVNFYYLSYGAFTVKECEQNLERKTTKLTMYDDMIKAMEKYNLSLTYPMANYQFLNAVLTECGITLETTVTSGNMALQRDVETYNDSYTYRDVLDDFAEMMGSVFYISSNNKLCYGPHSYYPQQDLDETQLATIKIGDKFNTVSNIVFARVPQEDNVHYPATIGDGEIIRFENNMLVEGTLVQGVADRTLYLQGTYNYVRNDVINYYPVEIESYGYLIYEPGDVVYFNITNTSGQVDTFKTYWYSVNIEFGQGIKEKMVCEVPASNETDFTKSTSESQRERSTYIYVDKVTGEISSHVNDIEVVVDNSVASYTYRYYKSTSATTQPSDADFDGSGGSDTMPAREDGYYIWRRTTQTKNGGTSSKVYEMIQGADGAQGQTGPEGPQGVGITEVKPLYYLKDSRLKIDLEGNTLQDGTPTPSVPVEIQSVGGDNKISVMGKNLLNLEDSHKYTALVSFIDGGIRVTSNADTTNRYATLILPDYVLGKTITLSADVTTSSTNYGSIRAYFIKSNYQADTAISNGSTGNTSTGHVSKTVDIPATKPSTAKYVGILVYAQTSGTMASGLYVDYKNFQVEIGSTETAYEPCQEQVYPINLPVENLLSDERYQSEQNMNSIFIGGTRDDNYSIHLSAGTYTFTQNTTSNVYSYYRKTTDSQNYYFASWSTGLKSTTLTLDEGDYKFWFYSNDDHGGITIDSIIYYQLEKGSVANTYTPYGTTPIKLNKIGNYADNFHKVGSTWYLEKQIKQLTVTGTENWQKSSSSSTVSFYWSNDEAINDVNFDTIPTDSGDGAARIAQAYCDRFVAGAYSANTLPDVFDADGYGIFTINKNSTYAQLRFNMGIDSAYTTAGTFKPYLQSIKPVVYYVLATPVDIEITDATLVSQLDALANATSYPGNTNISQRNAYLPFNIEYEENAITYPPNPVPEITLYSTEPNVWSLMPPTHIENYVYFTSLQTKYTNNTFTCSTVVLSSELNGAYKEITTMNTDIIQNRSAISLKADEQTLTNIIYGDGTERNVGIANRVSDLEVTAGEISTTVTNDVVWKDAIGDYGYQTESQVRQTAENVMATLSATVSRNGEAIRTIQGGVNVELVTDTTPSYTKVTIGNSESLVRGVFTNTSLDFETGFGNDAEKLAWLDSSEGLGASAVSIGDSTTSGNRWRLITREGGSHFTITRHR